MATTSMAVESAHSWQLVRWQGIDGNLRTLPWAATQTVFRPLGFRAFSAGFVFKTTQTVSKTLESGGKSSGKFLKTVGVSETVGSQREVVPRGRGGEEGTGRVVDRLAGFVHSITTLPSLRSRACARDQSRWFGVGPGSSATRSVSDDRQSKSAFRRGASTAVRDGSQPGRGGKPSRSGYA